MKLEFPPDKLRPIGSEQMNLAHELAEKSPRHRSIVRYHEHAEALQRMINAVEPESYVRPHKHENPDKVEVFVALRGGALICLYQETGELREAMEIRASRAPR